MRDLDALVEAWMIRRRIKKVIDKEADTVDGGVPEDRVIELMEGVAYEPETVETVIDELKRFGEVYEAADGELLTD